MLVLEGPELLMLCNDSLPKSMVSNSFLWSNANSSVRLASKSGLPPAVLLSVQLGGGLMKDTT